MSVVADDVKTTVDQLLRAMSAKNVVSDPMEIGDNVIITITKVGMGFGTGKGENKGGAGPQGAEGAGGAAGVSPVAVLVVHKSTPGPAGVEVRSLAPPSGIGKAIGDIANTILNVRDEEKAKKAAEKTQ